MKTLIASCGLAIALVTTSMISASSVGQTVLYRTTPYNLPPCPTCGGGTAVVSVAQRSVSSNLPYDGRIVLGAQESQVLRQRVSVPLDRLVEPTTLAEWVQGPAGIVAPAAEPIVKSVERAGAAATDRVNNPFVDDTQPAAKTAEPVAEAVDPFAIDGGSGGAPKSSADNGGTVPAKKLVGILGKVLSRSAPVPSMDRIKQALPSVPTPGGGPPGQAMPMPPQRSPDSAGGPGANEDPFAR
jgi:hypothetical protein